MRAFIVRCVRAFFEGVHEGIYCEGECVRAFIVRESV